MSEKCARTRTEKDRNGSKECISRFTKFNAIAILARKSRSAERPTFLEMSDPTTDTLASFKLELAEALTQLPPNTPTSLWGIDVSALTGSPRESTILSKFLHARDDSVSEGVTMLLETLKVKVLQKLK